MSNILVPVTDVAAALNSQKATIAAANRELNAFNRKAKDSPLSRSDLDRIKRVEDIRDRSKSSLVEQKAIQSQYQQTSNLVSGLQNFASLSAFQKFTSGQRLNASDAIQFASYLEKPIFNLIQKYQGKQQQQTNSYTGQGFGNNPNQSIGTVASALFGKEALSNVKFGPLSSFNFDYKKIYDRQQMLSFDKSGGIRINRMKEILAGKIPSSLQQFEDSILASDAADSIRTGIGTAGQISKNLLKYSPELAKNTANYAKGILKSVKAGLSSGESAFSANGVLAAAYAAYHVATQVTDKLEENDALRYYLRDAREGSVSQDERERINNMGTFNGKTYTESIKNYFANPYTDSKENKAAQATSASAFGTEGANADYRRALDFVGIGGSVFDKAVAERRKVLGRDLDESDYADLRVQLGNGALKGPLDSNQSKKLLLAEQEIINRVYKDDFFGRRWASIKSNGSHQYNLPDFLRPSAQQEINDYTNLVAKEKPEQKKGVKNAVLTNVDIIKEHQISALETWYGEHRRTRTYFPFDVNELHYNRLGKKSD